MQRQKFWGWTPNYLIYICWFSIGHWRTVCLVIGFPLILYVGMERYVLRSPSGKLYNVRTPCFFETSFFRHFGWNKWNLIFIGSFYVFCNIQLSRLACMFLYTKNKALLKMYVWEKKRKERKEVKQMKAKEKPHMVLVTSKTAFDDVELGGECAPTCMPCNPCKPGVNPDSCEPDGCYPSCSPCNPCSPCSPD